MPKSLLPLIVLSVLLSMNQHGKISEDVSPQTRWMGEARIYSVIQIGDALRLELRIEPVLPHIACEQLKQAGQNNWHSFELAFALQKEWCRHA